MTNYSCHLPNYLLLNLSNNSNKYLIKIHYFPDTVLSPFYIIRKAYSNESFSIVDSDFTSIKNEFIKFFLHVQCFIRKNIIFLVTKQYVKKRASQYLN